MQKKKVCIIAPSLSLGGNERHLSILANYFHSTKRVEVHYVIVYNMEQFFNLDKDIKLYVPPLDKKGKNKLFYIIQALWFVRKSVISIKPDVILSFGEELNSYILSSLLFTNFRHVIADTGSPNLQHKFWLRIARKILYPRATAVIAQTKIAAKQKSKMLKGKTTIKVIPNPARAIVKYPNIERKNQIVYIGRLHKEKGVDVLIEAFATITNRKDWKLILAGAGIHKNYFVEQVKSLCEEDNIIFVGKVKEVDKLLAKSKIFGFTSHGEGFPNALLEAMCAGVPVVSYDCVAGPAEIITNNKNGFLIKYGDKSSFIEHLEYLMKHEEERKRMSENAIKSCKKFNLEKVGSQYLNFLLDHSGE